MDKAQTLALSSATESQLLQVKREMGSYEMKQSVIIVGAGPAGLGVAACLKKEGIESLILEKEHSAGASWHKHYDRLHLHTTRVFSSLPHLPMSKSFGRYPSKDHMIDYFASYAEYFDLNIAYGTELLCAQFAEAKWQLKTNQAAFESQNLVIATGLNRKPFLPEWPGQETYQGQFLHSSQYETGAAYKGQNVLVVGLGNSGGEIAVDLYEHGANVTLSVRGPVNVIPRDFFGIPIQLLAIIQSIFPSSLVDKLNGIVMTLLKGNLTDHGIIKPKEGAITQINTKKQVPLIDVGTVDLIKEDKLAVNPGITKFEENAVVFNNDTRAFFDTVILATGYRADVNDFLANDAAYNAKGEPISSGEESTLSGLYFCGYNVAATGMLREIAIEAKQISALISKGSKS